MPWLAQPNLAFDALQAATVGACGRVVVAGSRRGLPACVTWSDDGGRSWSVIDREGVGAHATIAPRAGAGLLQWSGSSLSITDDFAAWTREDVGSLEASALQDQSSASRGGTLPTQVAGELPGASASIVLCDTWYNSYSDDALSAVQIFVRGEPRPRLVLEQYGGLTEVLVRGARIYAAEGPCGWILASSDAGATWDKTLLPSYGALAIDAGEVFWLVESRERARVFTSSDGGAAWRELAAPRNEGFDAIAAEGRFVVLRDARHGTLHVSSDGGASFSTTPPVGDVTKRKKLLAHPRGVLVVEEAGALWTWA